MGAFRFLRNFKFQPLASVWTRTHPNEHEDEETKGFLDGKGYQENKNGGISRTAIVLTVLNALMLLTSSTWFMIWYCNHFIVLNAALRRTSSYSPVWNLVDLEPSVKMLNGTYYPPKSGGSIARQQPNPEADAIWDEWELTRVFPITKEDVLKIGKDPSTVAKLEDDIWGLGDDAYAAIFDSYHQIHCLNSLRHIAYGNYYNKSQGRVDTIKQREIHINHCVDMLMQTLQCSANLNLITLHWVETQEYPFPDMSINRQCINFDKFTQWRKENTIDMDKYVEVMKQPEGDKPGIKQIPAADAYYEYWGYDNPNHRPKPEGHGIPLDDDSNL